MMKRVAIIGSGNWGSTIGKIVAQNVINSNEFDSKVKMWVFEEMINDEKLSDIINIQHHNIKYLPGIKLPENLIAEPELLKAIDGADLLVFVLPHQFLSKVLEQCKAMIKKTAIGITLIKGLIVPEFGRIQLSSELIAEKLGIECGALMGANIATEVAKETFCEATIGFKTKNSGESFKSIFQTEYFRIKCITDVTSCELCGALKNIVAVASGIADGLGFGDNTKAALIRIGLIEIKKFIYEFFPDSNPLDSTFLESCGIADLITTCYGGRNRKVGEALAREGGNLDEIEKKLLNGQSAQGPLTAKEVYGFLEAKKKIKDYPLLTGIYKICSGKVEAKNIIEFLKNHPCHD